MDEINGGIRVLVYDKDGNGGLEPGGVLDIPDAPPAFLLTPPPTSATVGEAVRDVCLRVFALQSRLGYGHTLALAWHSLCDIIARQCSALIGQEYGANMADAALDLAVERCVLSRFTTNEGVEMVTTGSQFDGCSEGESEIAFC